MIETETTVHVTGSTKEEVKASFEAAKAHYTPAGEDRPSRGIMNRLYREAKACNEAINAAETEADAIEADADRHAQPEATAESEAALAERIKAAQAPRPASDVDALLDDPTLPKPRSAAGANAAHETAKASRNRAKVDRNIQAADAAADRVDSLITEAQDRAADPYRTAMRNRKEAGRKRGPGVKVSDEALTGYIKGLVAAHPDYLVGQVWECCMWTAKFAISRSRFDTAWRAATGTEPVRRVTNRRAA